jgi:hypothetical protein
LLLISEAALRGHLAFFGSATENVFSASLHFLFGHLAFFARPPHIFWSSTLHFFPASLHFLLGLLAFLLGHLTFFGRPPGIWCFLLACRPGPGNTLFARAGELKAVSAS